MAGEMIAHRLRSRKVLLMFSSIAVAVIGGGWLGERVMSQIWGLGKPVLFYADPVFGFRARPNREYHRVKGAYLAFNNLSLRADQDWTERTPNKVLFLGDSVTYGGSFVGNHDLFSYRSVEVGLGREYESGNAGVSAWGVENIHGLVVESEFTPAINYVTVLTEFDFFRGLVRFHGQPFFSQEIDSAYEELWLLFCYHQSKRRWPNWIADASPERRREIAERAVLKLEQLHNFLTERGYRHRIFITPSLAQARGRIDRNPMVAELLQATDLPVEYLLDDVRARELSDDQVQACYRDFIHLSVAGHHLWADILSPKLRSMLDSSLPPQRTENDE